MEPWDVAQTAHSRTKSEPSGANDRSAAAYAAEIDSAAANVLAVYRGRQVPSEKANDLIGDVLRASWMPPPAVSRDTYDDLVSTGNLRLLPVATRERIAEYYRQVSVYGDREKSFSGVLSSGYWRVPAVVLGPDLLPDVWQAIATLPRGQVLGADVITVSPRELQEVVGRLRKMPDLETWIASVRHVMVQRQVIYAQRLTAEAQQVQDVLNVVR